MTMNVHSRIFLPDPAQQQVIVLQGNCVGWFTKDQNVAYIGICIFRYIKCDVVVGIIGKSFDPVEGTSKKMDTERSYDEKS